MSEQNRFWRIEQQVESLKAKTTRLETAVIRLEIWAAKHQSATIDKLATDAGIKEQEEVDPN